MLAALSKALLAQGFLFLFYFKSMIQKMSWVLLLLVLFYLFLTFLVMAYFRFQ